MTITKNQVVISRQKDFVKCKVYKITTEIMRYKYNYANQCTIAKYSHSIWLWDIKLQLLEIK